MGASAAACGDPQTLGEEALVRLLDVNEPDNFSLAAAYACGYGVLGLAQQEGTAPYWYQQIDPLDALFLGTLCSREPFTDEFAFANARDAWLRLLRGTAHGKAIERFVREAVALSSELGLAVDDGKLMLALIGRLEAAGLDRRRLPRRLLPEAALRGCRVICGPPPDLRLPEPPGDAKERLKRFWKSEDEASWNEDTPQAVLRAGLRRLRDAGLSVKKESGVLLPALYAALLANPGEPLEDLGKHAQAWALSLNEALPLVRVLDILLVAPELEMTVSDALGRLLAVPAFTQPIPSEALLWTSSPGLALPRLAFELGAPEVTTAFGSITPDELDQAGTYFRMGVSSAARREADDLEEPNSVDGPDGAQEEPDERWAERRHAVRKAVQRRMRDKHEESAGARDPGDHPVKAIWNADGSSVRHLSTEAVELLELQVDCFRKKFGREPGPGDPLFFDLDASEPTPITRNDIDSMMLDMADLAEELGIDPVFFHAGCEVGYMVTEENKDMFTKAEVIAYSRAVARLRQAEG
ncbi:hypothetical protein [Streptomyces formicae]|uniref:Uncharacterized protein n=1 Tax=Streptomyces formicae TaxID=1616117 RepID=A0A291QAE1_9ACTN|nr:hypothetical protein [Streptomyces formicae]ATL28659.1 hypothetical protein KY5_3641c [Streptomyces formicae]